MLMLCTVLAAAEARALPPIHTENDSERIAWSLLMSTATVIVLPILFATLATEWARTLDELHPQVAAVPGGAALTIHGSF